MVHRGGSKEADHGPSGGPSEKKVGTKPPERLNVWVPFGLSRFEWVRRDITKFLSGQGKK